MGDCTGPEKARRVRATLDLTRFETVHAYGDTREDVQLLELATRRYFRWREMPLEGRVTREQFEMR